jgi:spore coat protein CotH
MLNRIRVFPLVVILLAALSRVAVAQAPPDPTAALFDDTVIHDISLAVNPRDWASLKEHFQDDTYYVADFSWRGQVVRNIGIRSRGAGSRRPDKPSLRVDFNRYTTGQKFLGLESVVLRNNSQDASNMRERLSMLFFKRMGEVASREAHARLFVNNEFAGLFTIVESLVDKDYLRKYLGENDGYLFKYYFDNAAVLAGIKPYGFEYLGSDPALYVPVPFEPKTHEDDAQPEVLVRLVQAINDTTAAWRQIMPEYLDLAKFIHHLAVENFLAEEDGITGDYGMNNFYLYRFTNKNLFMFLPWDKSNTFWDTNFSIFRNIKDGPVDRRNRLVLRAFQEPDLLKLYLDTLLECADSASSGAGASPTDPPFAQGWLEREVNREYDQIHTAALADTILYTNAQFEEAAATVKAIARDRSEAVRQQVAARR